jgi:hypothetical protein
MTSALGTQTAKPTQTSLGVRVSLNPIVRVGMPVYSYGPQSRQAGFRAVMGSTHPFQLPT